VDAAIEGFLAGRLSDAGFANETEDYFGNDAACNAIVNTIQFELHDVFRDAHFYDYTTEQRLDCLRWMLIIRIFLRSEVAFSEGVWKRVLHRINAKYWPFQTLEQLDAEVWRQSKETPDLLLGLTPELHVPERPPKRWWQWWR
jgi:hypothetical protein